MIDKDGWKGSDRYKKGKWKMKKGEFIDKRREGGKVINKEGREN